LPTAFITVNQIRLQRLIIGTHREQAELVRGMEPTGLKPVIDRSFPLKQLADSFHYDKSDHHFGKICLEV
jgi:NADPH:quinone reductase-like Zn-dependent oxidoreductase